MPRNLLGSDDALNAEIMAAVASVHPNDNGDAKTVAENAFEALSDDAFTYLAYGAFLCLARDAAATDVAVLKARRDQARAKLADLGGQAA